MIDRGFSGMGRQTKWWQGKSFFIGTTKVTPLASLNSGRCVQANRRRVSHAYLFQPTLLRYVHRNPIIARCRFEKNTNHYCQRDYEADDAGTIRAKPTLGEFGVVHKPRFLLGSALADSGFGRGIGGCFV